MATVLMTPPPARKTMASKDPTPQEIIASARQAPAMGAGAFRVTAVSACLLWASFTPLGWGPLAWIALVPLLLLVRLERPTRRMYWGTYFGGFLFWCPTLQWMRLGDPTMYIAWMAFAIYLALYFPLFVGLSRLAVWRLKVPLILAVPAVWTGLEYVRAHALTGFSWYQLGHSQFYWLELIQISDLVGAYGISFVVAMGSAAIVEMLPLPVFTRLKLLPQSGTSPISATTQSSQQRWIMAGSFLIVLGTTLTYGTYRRSHAAFEAGPRVAAIQGNFPSSLAPQQAERDHEIFVKHRQLTAEAIKLQPDLILWPETMFPWPYFAKADDLDTAAFKEVTKDVDPTYWNENHEIKQRLKSLSQASAAAVVCGVQTVTANQNGLRLYNSALFIRPDQGFTARYDKLHRVPFGEYIPFAESVPFLGWFTPYRGSFGIQAGEQGVAFDYKGIRYAPVICFEDTVPHVVRQCLRQGRTTNDKSHKVDVLLNLSNDGWFHGSSELDQHLITAAFRAVEFRTPMVRAVNTGISAIIDGDGAIRVKAKNADTGHSKEVDAVLCDFVPLDHRHSAYLQHGDWFAQVCLGLCVVCFTTGVWSRFSLRRKAT
ncbi:MAG: lnt [Planctomycetaceae bacterium]|nr:lnt [Planctomycetaceae bacterium]